MNAQNQYFELVDRILETGEDRKDRTGTGTRGLFGERLVIDVSKSFPLLTVKFVPFRAVLSELLWFLEGSGDERRLAEILHGTRDPEKKTIWSPNAEGTTGAKYKPQFTGDLGKVYGNMWRKWPANYETFVKIQRRSKEPEGLVYYPEFTPLTAIITDDYTGQIKQNNEGHKFLIIENLGTVNGNSQYKIQFIKTGFITNVSRPNINHGCHRDWCEPRQAGVGVYGEPQIKKQSKLENRIYQLWDNMLSRCYDSNHPKYKFYGEKGVTVSADWLNFSNFRHSIKGIPGFYEWAQKSRYELDKDYYGANQYSRTTAIFIPKKYNLELSRTVDDGDTLVRRQLYIDQVAEAIWKLKNNPTDRRIIITAWNPGELDQMALPPCHMFMQFYLTNDKVLHCQMYQRSVDTFLGLPFNIASYAALMYIIANEVGATPGKLTMCLGDTHIYKDHFDQCRELLNRQYLRLPKSPTLSIRPGVPIDKLTMGDFTLSDYQYLPAIKAKMSA